MKKLLFLLFLISCSSLYSQNLIQTYIDRCTGEVKVFSVPANGSTVVAFYNKSKVFTYQDFQNGTLQAWLEETYLWWSSLNPCSTNQTQQTTVQTTVQQTTTQATQAATQAAVQSQPTPVVNVSPPPTTSTAPTQSAPEVNTSVMDTPSTDTSVAVADTGPQVSTNEPTSQTDTSATTEVSTGETGTTESTTEAPSTETSESQTETQQTESTSDDSGGTDSTTSETDDSSSSQDENGGESESTTEETTEETSEKSSETEESEVEEETTEEESNEEESSEEESGSEEEESSEEESEEESSEEEEDNKGEKKKRQRKTFSPPIISANIASMQNIDGSFNQTMTIGISRSSLLGTETYAINGMVWDNLQQFMLNGSYSKVHINKEGRVNRVYSASLGGARMFTTTMGNMGHSLTYLGKKGSVKGLALSSSLISVEFDYFKGKISQDAVLFAPALTGFYTKSFIYSPRLTVSPMLAVSSPFMLHDWFNQTTTWNDDLMAIVGSSFNVSLTQRFKLNIGVNTIHNTNPNIRMTWNFTIGSRFSF